MFHYFMIFFEFNNIRHRFNLETINSGINITNSATI